MKAHPRASLRNLARREGLAAGLADTRGHQIGPNRCPYTARSRVLATVWGRAWRAGQCRQRGEEAKQ